MNVIVEGLGLKLVPHREGLCFELHAWKSRRKVPSGRYVGTMAPGGSHGPHVASGEDFPSGLPFVEFETESLTMRNKLEAEAFDDDVHESPLIG